MRVHKKHQELLEKGLTYTKVVQKEKHITIGCILE